MPKFSNASKAQLATCDERLQLLANMAITIVDFTILEGHRNKEKQDAYYATGASKVKYPYGEHNSIPSRAFDFTPYPQDWRDKPAAISRFMLIAGVLLVCSRIIGIKIRFGWDWNRNVDPRDEKFLDWGHVELDEP